MSQFAWHVASGDLVPGAHNAAPFQCPPFLPFPVMQIPGLVCESYRESNGSVGARNIAAMVTKKAWCGDVIYFWTGSDASAICAGVMPYLLPSGLSPFPQHLQWEHPDRHVVDTAAQ